MIKLLLSLHKLSYGCNEKYHYKTKNKGLWLLCIFTYTIIRFLFFYYMKFRSFFNVSPSINENINEKIVISLTSFPARINNVWMVIDSMCRQEMRPESINLYLAEEEFSDKKTPSNLEKYKRYGLKICWVKNNLKPHNKYYYAMKENPHKYVITIDDDIYYRSDLVSRLWEMSQFHKGCVCANRVTKIYDDNLSLKKYNQWGIGQEEPYGVSFNYLALGTCGVIYPPLLLNSSSLFDIESIKRDCPKADDLWLKCHETLAQIPVATGDFYGHSIEIYGSQIISLQSTNCNDSVKSGNDIQWDNLNRVYKISYILKELVCNERNNGNRIICF